jgi:hypothetical protein|tara:strand:- start:752 stop:1006 length:255 start_codon:yes stop_codon:yes gene_type:complete
METSSAHTQALALVVQKEFGMITKVIMREDGSADLILDGDGYWADGTLAFSCADGKEALKIQQTLDDALREFFPTQPVPISAMG